MIKLKVDLGERSYPIFIGSGILDDLTEMLHIYNYAQQVVLITDKNVGKFYGKRLTQNFDKTEKFELIQIPAGEKSKSLKTATFIINHMLELGFDRNCTVLAVGGGVVGDLAAFVASIYLRGVNIIQVPTTLVAQVDSSIGGKTGINHSLGKNLIGTFFQPKLVWIDLSMLSTLPKNELICGLGEIIKYGIIRDSNLFRHVEHNWQKILSLDFDFIQGVVKRCCAIKAELVEQDERDNNKRQILNFGHTVGHAFEAASGFKNISHGEAVLLGMLVESKISLELGKLADEQFKVIQSLIVQLIAPANFQDFETDHLLQFMKRDKKAADGQIKCVLPKKIGEVSIDNIEPTLIKKALYYLKSLS